MYGVKQFYHKVNSIFYLKFSSSQCNRSSDDTQLYLSRVQWFTFQTCKLAR